MSPNEKVVEVNAGAKKSSKEALKARIRLPGWVTMREELVISGISGIFPSSRDVKEYMDNLYAGVDMVAATKNPRWPPGYLSLPEKAGNIPSECDCFDHDFFGLSESEANVLDFQTRVLAEKIYEAICDAGVDPAALRDSKTGIFVARCFESLPEVAERNIESKSAYVMAQNAHLAYCLGFRGPSSQAEAACASGLIAFDQAVRMMRTGACEAAVVASTNACFNPNAAKMFHEMKMTSPDCACKVFDESASGYGRAEAICVLFMQKSKDAKRIYAKVLHTKCNADGYKEEGITFPKWETQSKLIVETYEEIGLNPNECDFMESHATGTQAGDPVEAKAMAEACCKKRERPLLIGAHKSNIGHTEGSSGLCALTKVIGAFQNKLIPPNIHFKNPNKEIPELLDGRLKLVVECTPFEGKIVSVNNWGFGGANSHAILCGPSHHVKDNSYKIADGIPRLILFCGRTADSVNYGFDYIEKIKSKLTREFLALLQQIAFRHPKWMPYRGCMLVDKSRQIIREVGNELSKNRQLWFVFGGMGSQWQSMAKSLLSLYPFAFSIVASHQTLKEKFDFDLLSVVDGDENINQVVNAFVGITAVQIALVDVLRYLGVEPDGIIGYSIGEIACAYADCSLTAAQALAVAYVRGSCVARANLDEGVMVAVGLSFEEAQKRCPSGVSIACDNGPDSVTLAGPKKQMLQLIKQLKKEDIFFKEVDSCGLAFHSTAMASTERSLRRELSKLDLPCIRRSKKWISTSFSPLDWSTDDCQYCGAEYFSDDLIKPVHFRQAIEKIPSDAVVVEISPHSLLTPLLKRSLGSDVNCVALMCRNADWLPLLLKAVGELYSLGFNPSIDKLYAKVKLPAPGGTAFLSPMLAWKHDVKILVPRYPDYYGLCQWNLKFEIDLRFPDNAYLSGHCMDGRILLPATGYLFLAWKAFSSINGMDIKKMPIQFQDVRFHRANLLSQSSGSVFKILFLDKKFDVITSGGDVCCSGYVSVPDYPVLKFSGMFKQPNRNQVILKTKDIYKELRLRGYDYSGSFQGLIEVAADASFGKVKWTGEWVSFADSMMQIAIFGQPVRNLYLPTSISLLRCDPRVFKYENNAEIDVFFDNDLQIGVTAGMEVRGLGARGAPRKPATKPNLEKHIFFPNTVDCIYDENQFSEYLAYANHCDKLSEQIIEGKNHLDNSLNEKYLSNEAYLIGKQLNDISEKLNEDGDLKELIRGLKEEVDFYTDPLLNPFNDERLLKPILETIQENLTCQKAKVMELCCGGKRFLINDVIALLQKIRLRDNIGFHFTVGAQNFEGLKNVPPNTFTWDPKGAPETQFIPNMLNGQHILMLTDIGNNLSVEVVGAVLQTISDNLTDDGFLLTITRRQMFNFERFLELSNQDTANFSIINLTLSAQENGFQFIKSISDGISFDVMLFRKITKRPPGKMLQICNDDFAWLNEVKRYFQLWADGKSEEHLWLLNSESNSGVLGLVNCLRKEPNGEKLHCIYSDTKLDTIPNSVSQSNLGLNAYCEGEWGTYQHMAIPLDAEKRLVKHAYLNAAVRGDLSSFQWFESLHKHWPDGKKENEILVMVYAAALNFKDVMVASGKLSVESLPGQHRFEDGLLGFEYAGLDENGNRVMGITERGGLATTIVTKKSLFCWPIPTGWSMEEAVTVPVVYGTAYYALIIRGELRRGESILIHAGSGGVGQAAIAICQSYDCKIYTTVGTKEKREFLIKHFGLKEDQIFNSRDTSFEQGVLQITNGRGVDLVLNSLAEEKLRASLRCLANNGRFLEIGKYDLEMNNSLNLGRMFRNKVYHGIFLDTLFTETPKKQQREKKILSHLLIDGIKSGVVKPLVRTVFKVDEVEKAFRFMASGKHIGKVVIKINNEGEEFNNTAVLAVPRTILHSDKVYLLTGGLGGFGLEVAQWLCERNAKKLVLTSRSGIKDAYQQVVINKLKAQGVEVYLWTGDATTRDDVKEVLLYAKRFGELGGIFHFPMVLLDNLIENQTQDTFKQCITPKLTMALLLDEETRKLQCNLDYFVMFSSIVSGLGNAGQSNYGFANSGIERLCEQRRKEGLPGVAIQWGPIGDTGFVAEKFGNVSLGRALQQRMPFCLSTLDRLLQSKCPVVMSIVLKDKNAGADSKDLLGQICHILGVKDPNKLDPNTTLVELGMDSLMGVEIKQALERDYDTVLTLQEIRQLKVSDIRDFENRKTNRSEKKEESFADLRLPTDPFVKLNEVASGKPIFFVPPLEGNFMLLEPYAKRLSRPVYGLNWTRDMNKLKNVVVVAERNIATMRKLQAEDALDIVGYSFGANVAFEICCLLGKKSTGSLIMLDGSPTHFHQLKETGKINTQNFFKVNDEKDAQIAVICSFLMQYTVFNVEELKMQLNKIEDFEARFAFAGESVPIPGLTGHDLADAIEAFYVKAKMIYLHTPERRLQSDVLLIRAKESNVVKIESEVVEDDYGLKSLGDGKCEVVILDGNHDSFLSENLDRIHALTKRHLQIMESC